MSAELKNVVERAIILSRDKKIIRSQHLSFGACMQQEPGFQLDVQQDTIPTLDELEASYLKMLLEKHAGHRATVAQVMGISERHVYRLISNINRSKSCPPRLKRMLLEQALFARRARAVFSPSCVIIRPSRVTTGS